MKFSCYINHIPRLHQMDEFKNSKYKFWFLYKIKGVTYDEGKHFSDFCFINKSTADDIFQEEDGDKAIIRLGITFYTFFNEGCIFSLEGYLLTRPPYSTKTNDNTLFFSTTNFPKPTSFNVLESKQNFNACFPFEIINSKHYIFTLKRDGQITKVLIPEHVICSYIFFRNTFVTQRIFDDSLIECFDLSNFETVKLDNDLVALRIFYDNRKILPQEAYSIAQFFNIKKGRNAINSITGNLIKNFTEFGRDKEAPSVNVNLDFLKDLEMELTGKTFQNKHGIFFYAYEVTNLKCCVDKLSKYDNILLEPIFKENNYKRLLLRRGTQYRLINNLVCKEKKFSIYNSPRPVFYTGTNVYVKEYNPYVPDKFVLLSDFYSFHITNNYKERKTIGLSRAMIRNFKKHEITASILQYNSLNEIVSRLKVANSVYSFIVFELEVMSKKVYYIELSYDFIFLLHNNSTAEVLLIDLILVIENVIHNYALENKKFRSFQKFDKDHYHSKFGITILFQSDLIKYRERINANNAFDYIQLIKNNINNIIFN